MTDHWPILAAAYRSAEDPRDTQEMPAVTGLTERDVQQLETDLVGDPELAALARGDRPTT